MATGARLGKSRGLASFRQRDIARAVRAVLSTGLDVARVDIGADGKITIHTGKSIDGSAASEQELDRELAEFEVRHR